MKLFEITSLCMADFEKCINDIPLKNAGEYHWR